MSHFQSLGINWDLKNAQYGWVERTEDLDARDDGPIFFDEATPRGNKAPLFHSTASSHLLSAMSAFNEESSTSHPVPSKPPKLPSSPGRRQMTEDNSKESSWFRPKFLSNPMSGLSSLPNAMLNQVDVESAAESSSLYSRSKDEAEDRYVVGYTTSLCAVSFTTN